MRRGGSVGVPTTTAAARQHWKFVPEARRPWVPSLGHNTRSPGNPAGCSQGDGEMARARGKGKNGYVTDQTRRTCSQGLLRGWEPHLPELAPGQVMANWRTLQGDGTGQSLR